MKLRPAQATPHGGGALRPVSRQVGRDAEECSLQGLATRLTQRHGGGQTPVLMALTTQEPGQAWDQPTVL